ncbi:MAG: hypothetical protein RI919_625 [Actinomycetota bacterium]
MKVLFIQHDHVSPTGPVGERFRERGFETQEILVVQEHQFGEPNVAFTFPDFADYEIRAAVSSGKPVLGICFGGQLIARAMGGSVAPAPKGEIGWTNIWSERPDLISNGPWFQFHYDRWQLPPGAVEIARNPVASQAFLINNSLAVQFHPELNAAGLKGWLDWGGDKKVLEDGQDPIVMMRQTEAEEADARARSFALVDAFIDQVSGL